MIERDKRERERAREKKRERKRERERERVIVALVNEEIRPDTRPPKLSHPNLFHNKIRP